MENILGYIISKKSPLYIINTTKKQKAKKQKQKQNPTKKTQKKKFPIRKDYKQSRKRKPTKKTNPQKALLYCLYLLQQNILLPSKSL